MSFGSVTSLLLSARFHCDRVRAAAQWTAFGLASAWSLNRPKMTIPGPIKTTGHAGHSDEILMPKAARREVGNHHGPHRSQVDRRLPPLLHETPSCRIIAGRGTTELHAEQRVRRPS